MAENNPNDEPVPSSPYRGTPASIDPYTATSPQASPTTAGNPSNPFPSTAKIIAIVGFMWVAYFLNY
ncbi:MAG: hypothetical protein ACK52S_17940, partial [Pirellula sp.]